MHRAIHSSCGFAAVVLLTSCGGSSPAAQAKKEAQSLISSAATIRMTADAWLSGAVPAAFADKTLQKEPKTITSHPMPRDARAMLLQAAAAMRATVRAMRTAVRQHEHSALDPLLQQLSRTEQTLLALERASGAS